MIAALHKASLHPTREPTVWYEPMGSPHEAISRPIWQQTRQQIEQEPGIMLIVHDDTQVGSPPEGEVWIHVADRYADMFAFLQRCRQMGTFFLVRAAQNRRILSEEEQAEPELDHLLDRAKSWPAQAQGSIDVPSEHE